MSGGRMPGGEYVRGRDSGRVVSGAVAVWRWTFLPFPV